MSQLSGQYIRMRLAITSDTTHQEFQRKLSLSPIKDNKTYLGLLLMTIVSIPKPKVQYIKTLLKYKADINFTEPAIQEDPHSSNRSVLMMACQNSVVENVKYLLSHNDLQVGALDKKGKSVLNYALQNPREDEAVQMIKIILKQFPHLISNIPLNKKSLLYSTIDSKKMKILQFLLKNYCDPNEQPEPNKITPLCYVIQNNSNSEKNVVQEMALMLLKYKADPYIESYEKQDCFVVADRYLFDLSALIDKAQSLYPDEFQPKYHACLTTNTNADTRTALSKDDQFPQNFDDSQKIGQFSNEYCVIDQRNQNFKNIYENLKDQQSQKNIQDIQIGEHISNYVDQDSVCDYQRDHQTQKQIWEQKNQYLIGLDCHLNEQIYKHAIQCQKQYNNAANKVKTLQNFLTEVGRDLELSLGLIGSFATGLWTPHSDINMVFINQKANFVNISELLVKIHKRLVSNRKKLQINQMYLNINIDFPNIKFRFKNLRIQISIFQRKCSGRKYVNFISQCLFRCPNIRPIFFAVHSILQNFNLHLPTERGLKTYTIFLMILQSINWYPSQSLGQNFINFVNHFTNGNRYKNQRFNPQTNQSQINFDMIDPLNYQNNTGGLKTDTKRLVEMFKTIYYTLQQAINQLDRSFTFQGLLQLNNMFS